MYTAGTSSFLGAVEKLSEAIAEAQQFPHLLGEVANATALQEQWIRRAQAVERLDTVMKQVRAPPTLQGRGKKQSKPSNKGDPRGPDLGMLEQRVKLLEVSK